MKLSEINNTVFVKPINMLEMFHTNNPIIQVMGQEEEKEDQENHEPKMPDLSELSNQNEIDNSREDLRRVLDSLLTDVETMSIDRVNSILTMLNSINPTGNL